MQQVYIVTGCDYVSYFSGIGKATFLNCFYQHADFILANEDISMTCTSTSTQGFLSLIRLIGTVYLKKNLATGVSKLSFETPVQLYNSVIAEDEEKKHKLWYQ